MGGVVNHEGVGLVTAGFIRRGKKRQKRQKRQV